MDLLIINLTKVSQVGSNQRLTPNQQIEILKKGFNLTMSGGTIKELKGTVAHLRFSTFSKKNP